MTAAWSEVDTSQLGPSDRIDAEYYDPAWLELQTELGQSGFVPVPLGSLIREGNRVVYENTEIVDSPDDPTDYVRFLQAANVWRRLPVINSDGIGWVRRSDWERYPTGRIQPGELLIEVKGKAEKVAVVPEDFFPETLVTGTLFKATVDDTQIDPGYVVAYLMSRFGRGLRKRCLTNTLIGFVSKAELYSIPVVRPSRGEQARVAHFVQRCLEAERDARDLYAEAEQLLLGLLPALARTTSEPDLVYEANSDLVHSLDRLDAEFYQPQKWKVLEALLSSSSRSLETYFQPETMLWDPRKADEPMVRNYDLTDAFFPFLDDTKELVSPDEVGSNKKRFRTGDVLISRLRAYLRQVAIALVSDDTNSVASTEFVVLRSTGTEQIALSAETLLLYLRSAPVQTVLRWSQDGSNHPRFDARVLLRLPVPDKVIHENLGLTQQIQDSIRRLREAEAALSAATSLVEDIIRRGLVNGRTS